MGLPTRVSLSVMGILVGWSELAATNAPVADELIEAVFRMN